MQSLVWVVMAILGVLFCVTLPIVAGLWSYVIHNHFKALSKWWWFLWFPAIVIASFAISLLLLKFLIWLN